MVATDNYQLPRWAQSVKQRYEGGIASVFCLHSNTRDLQPFGSQYLPLPFFLIYAFTGGKQLVVFYSIRTGITFADPIDWGAWQCGTP